MALTVPSCQKLRAPIPPSPALKSLTLQLSPVWSRISPRAARPAWLASLLDKTGDLVIAQIEIPEGDELNIVNSPVSDYQPGIHNLIVILKDSMNVEIDWISFE